MVTVFFLSNPVGGSTSKEDETVRNCLTAALVISQIVIVFLLYLVKKLKTESNDSSDGKLLNRLILLSCKTTFTLIMCFNFISTSGPQQILTSAGGDQENQQASKNNNRKNK